MAAITKTTSVLNLNFADNADTTTTWKINDPRSDVTLAEITTAVAPMFQNWASQTLGIFVNSNGNEIVRLKSAEREQVVKTVEQIL